MSPLAGRTCSRNVQAPRNFNSWTFFGVSLLKAKAGTNQVMEQTVQSFPTTQADALLVLDRWIGDGSASVVGQRWRSLAKSTRRRKAPFAT